MQTAFDKWHPINNIDESGPTMPEPRVQHFTSPKSKETGLRKAFGQYNVLASNTANGPPPPSNVAPYFNSVRNLFGSGGLTRVLRSGNNKIVF